MALFCWLQNCNDFGRFSRLSVKIDKFSHFPLTLFSCQVFCFVWWVYISVVQLFVVIYRVAVFECLLLIFRCCCCMVIVVGSWLSVSLTFLVFSLSIPSPAHFSCDDCIVKICFFNSHVNDFQNLKYGNTIFKKQKCFFIKNEIEKQVICCKSKLRSFFTLS